MALVSAYRLHAVTDPGPTTGPPVGASGVPRFYRSMSTLLLGEAGGRPSGTALPGRAVVCRPGRLFAFAATTRPSTVFLSAPPAVALWASAARRASVSYSTSGAVASRASTRRPCRGQQFHLAPSLSDPRPRLARRHRSRSRLLLHRRVRHCVPGRALRPAPARLDVHEPALCTRRLGALRPLHLRLCRIGLRSLLRCGPRGGRTFRVRTVPTRWRSANVWAASSTDARSSHKASAKLTCARAAARSASQRDCNLIASAPSASASSWPVRWRCRTICSATMLAVVIASRVPLDTTAWDGSSISSTMIFPYLLDSRYVDLVSIPLS